jgi:TRAP-type uncharacterized transport system fused permease subunit
MIGSLQTKAHAHVPTGVDLEALVAEADTGGRRLGGGLAKVVFCLAVAWSLFQLWYASPLAF